ncbi:MAG: YhgE/Pip family protein [Bacillota bacterium]|jgi:putative membrane protein
MNNIIRLIKTDLRNIRHNYIAWVVIIGLVIIPSLYAWFSTYAFWDPYGNTGNLTIAVANCDEGFRGDLLPMEINIGKKVEEALRDNDDIHWIFVDKKDAIDGVKSGKYYASLVIPADFSRHMLRIFSGDTEKATIDYYINEKKNAIAAKVTGEGAAMVENRIDEAFAMTIAQISVDTLETVANHLDNEDSDAIAAYIETEITSLSGGLSATADTVDALIEMNTALNDILALGDDALNNSAAIMSKDTSALSGDGKKAQDLSKEMNDIAAKMDAVYDTTSSIYKDIDSRISASLNNLNGDAAAAADALNASKNEVQAIIDRYESYRGAVANLAASLPDDLVLKSALGDLSADLGEAIARQKQLRDNIESAANDLSSAASDLASGQQNISAAIADGSSSLNASRGDFQKKVRPEWEELITLTEKTGESAVTIAQNLNDDISAAQKLSGSAKNDLSALNTALAETADRLREASNKLDNVGSVIIGDNGSIGAVLKNVLENDGESVGAFFASAVAVETNKIYPVENFASGMAPFYLSLALYVGALVMVALMKVNPSAKTVSTLENAKEYQIYLGRYFIFFAIGIAQSVLAALGLLFFVEIQCIHPLMFLLASLYCGFVFVFFLYTLTASFGNIGKVIAVIIMVLQVGGSGGTIPIQLAPDFFRMVHPFLPFTHSMAIFRECIGGFYGNVYWMEMGKLSVFLLLSLFLGLVLRKPLLKVNEKFIEKVESTKIM